MDARELRIGNCYIGYDGKVATVDLEFFALLYQNKVEVDELVHNYIPLSDEWLLGFGFEYNKHTYTWTLDKVDLERYATLEGIYFYGKKIEYLHQLQNLYFALTGEELEIKETVTP